jgi:hypothetical protein
MGWLTTISTCETTIGHGMEPKIFWSAKAEGVMQRLETELPSGMTLILMGDWCSED